MYKFGGVDSRSNPLILPPDRTLRCLNWVPTEDGHLQLRYGYTEIAQEVGDEITYTPPPPIEGTTFEVIYPTSQTGNYLYPDKAYDGNESTQSFGVPYTRASTGPTDPGGSSGAYSETWSFPARTGSAPDSVVLKILSRATKTIGSYRPWTLGPYNNPVYGDPITGSGTATNKISYSLNNGSSWTQVYNSENNNKEYNEITLDVSQDLSLVKVKAESSVSGTELSSTHEVYEIRIEVVVS